MAVLPGIYLGVVSTDAAKKGFATVQQQAVIEP
jgi:hypothetical protein